MLNELDEKIGELNSEYYTDVCAIDYGIDACQLKTHKIPDNIVLYPVFAVDREGYCVVFNDFSSSAGTYMVACVCEIETEMYNL